MLLAELENRLEDDDKYDEFFEDLCRICTRILRSRNNRSGRGASSYSPSSGVTIAPRRRR
ncbi:hypothetical protein C8039_02075 [Halogeometricum sp. wsp3]|nr:hypothetical protein C8039_02075 [Halogeometricum sp. wsp3]